jgi:hypothetical protein
MALVKLGGVDVDMDDPCALYQALYAAKLKLLAGERMEETEIRSPVSQNRIRVSVANMAAIDAELLKLSTACTAKTTGRPGRYRKTVRYACW